MSRLEIALDLAEANLRSEKSLFEKVNEKQQKSDLEIKRLYQECTSLKQTQQVYIEHILTLRKDVPLQTAVSRIITAIKALSSTAHDLA
jgi:hypothetical protein